MNKLFPDNNQRKFSCFICGKIYDLFSSMQTHVIEEHEQGREYVVCPVKYCGVAVRDLRAHFRHAHKSLKCPENCQMRAIVMYDIKGPNKRKKLPNFKEGFIISEKNNGKKVHFRSGWEEQVYNLLEKLDDVVAYEVEPVAIPYTLKGKNHHYYPDLIVKYANGAIEIWEIKPGTQVMNMTNQAKFNACEHYCKLRGWSFEVITENEIANLKRKTEK